MDEQTHNKLFIETAIDDNLFDSPDDLEKSVFSRKSFFDEIISIKDKIDNLIDLGSGWGSLLKLATDNGINAIGYEINQNMSGFCIEKLGLNVKDYFIDDPELQENSIDVISSLYSLPYLTNLNAYLKKIFNVLKPEGIFCGIVPNIDSFASETLEDEWEYLTPYKNLIYFSPDTLTNLLEKLGFVIEKLYTTTGNYDYKSLSYIVKDAFDLQSQQEIDEQIEVLNREGMGEEIWFFARKPLSDDFALSAINETVIEMPTEEPFVTQQDTFDTAQMYEEFEEKEVETEITEEEREFFTSKSLPKTDDEKIIEFNEYDDLDKILHKTFTAMKEYKKIKIIDKTGTLPDFVKNWNGVEVILPQTQNDVIDEIILEEEIQVRKDEDFTLDSISQQEQYFDSIETQDENIEITTEEQIIFEDIEITDKEEFEITQKEELKQQADIPDSPPSKETQAVSPENLPKLLKLNLGCGTDIREGFINIDLYSDDERVIKMDVRKLEFQDETVDLILASDILEHFSHREIDSVLKEWARVLKVDGNIIIRCPSLKLQARAYLNGEWDADVASYMIFGGQTNQGDYHCVAFDEQSIKKHLTLAGFEVVEFIEKYIPQNQGYTNLNMLIRAKKVKSLIDFEKKEEIIETDTSEFSDLDFGPQEPQTELVDTQVEMKPEIPEQLNIVWEGPQFKYNSLALVNREITYNLIRANVANVTIIPFGEDEFNPEGNEKFELLKANDIRFKPVVSEDVSKLPYVWIRHQWPVQNKEPKGAKWIIMQPWEYSRLTKQLAEIFKNADEVWTPSNFSRDAIVNSGIEFDKVQIIPNGVNPNIFKPFGSKYQLKTNKKIKFLYVGGTIYRKGIDILLQSYTTTFTKNDNVCLIIKDIGTDSYYRSFNARDKIQEIMTNPNNPEIIYIDEVLNEEDMASLYRACDVYVSPYRGEGFSLPTLEAMACGLPVVVTYGGSTDDFCTDEFAWKIPSKEVEFINKLNDEELVETATLLEPDISALNDILKDIYENPNEIFTRGMLASEVVRKNWTWQKSTLKVISRLDFIYDKNMYDKAKEILRSEPDIDLTFAEIIRLMVDREYEQAKNNYISLLYNPEINDELIYYANLGLAYIHLVQKDYGTCENYLIEILENHPETVDIKYIKAKMYFLKKQWIEGLEAVTEIYDNWKDWKYDTKIGLGLDDILCDTAEALLELDDPDNALKLYSHALKQNPNCSKACLGSAKCFLWAEAKDEAKEMLEWAVKLDAKNQEARNLLNELNNQND